MAANLQKGIFSDSDLTIGKLDFESENIALQNYVKNVEQGLKSSFTAAKEITFKGTNYTTENFHSVLLYNTLQTDFTVGIVKKILVPTKKNSGEPIIVFQSTEKQFEDDFGVYNIKMLSEFDGKVLSKAFTCFPFVSQAPRKHRTGSKSWKYYM